MIRKFVLILFLVIRVVAAALLTKVKLTNIFFTRAEEHMGISNLTDKRFKNVKKSVFFDHLFSFRLFIKESSVIKREKPVLNSTGKSCIFKLFD